jgi:hypothetical protein
MGIEKSIMLQHSLRTAVLDRGERWRLLVTESPTFEVLERYQYERLTEILFILFDDDFRYRVGEFQEELKAYRSKKWKEFHALQEEVFNERYSRTYLRSHDSYLTHKDIPFTVSRYRQCQVCGRVFYCTDGNGKTNVCSDACRKTRNNAAERQRKNGADGYRYDGQFGRLSPKSRAKLEEEMFLYFNPVADEDTDEWRFFHFVMSQSQRSPWSQDPQDVVCGTPTTHKLNTGHRSRLPMLRTKDTGGPTVYTVNIETGASRGNGCISTFDNNILEIKEKLPKIPNNPL